MNWNDLRHFLAISQARTLVGAGKTLGVEHTTVSRRLAALERALGARLFTRGPDGLSLTDAGRDILPCAQAIAAQIDDIQRRVVGGDARIEGAVRLTMPEAVNAYIIKALPDLRQRHPNLLIEMLSDNRAFDIRRGEADLALRFLDVSDPDLVARRIGTSGWSLYAAPAYLQRKGAPTSKDALAGHDIIGFAPSLARIVGAVFFETRARDAQVVLRANSLSTAHEAATRGIGIAALPCFMVSDPQALTRLFPDIIGTREISLVVHPDLVRAARVRAVMDFFVDCFTRDRALWSGEVDT